MANFLENISDPWLRKMCNAELTGVPLHRYKRNWSIACDLSESCLVLRVALFVGYTLPTTSNWPLFKLYFSDQELIKLK